MDLDEARRIWGPGIPEDILIEWVNAANKRLATFHLDPPDIPKGATIDIETTDQFPVKTN